MQTPDRRSACCVHADERHVRRGGAPRGSCKGSFSLLPTLAELRLCLREPHRASVSTPKRNCCIQKGAMPVTVTCSKLMAFAAGLFCKAR